MAAPSFRPLSCADPILESHYQTFLRSVFEDDVRTVRLERDAQHVSLVLAGCARIRRNLRTGRLYTESATASGRRPHAGSLLGIEHWWAGDGCVKNALVEAWGARFEEFLVDRHPALLERLKKADKVTQRERWRMKVESIADGPPIAKVPVEWSAVRRVVGLRRAGGGARRSKIVRGVIGALWNDIADREVLRIAQRFFGRRASFRAYNLVVSNRRFFEARLAETPHLAAVMGVWIAERAYKRRDLQPGLLGTVREEWMHEHGLTPAGWRYLCRLPESAVAMLWWWHCGGAHESSGACRKSIAVLFNALAERQSPVPPNTWLLEAAREIARGEEPDWGGNCANNFIERASPSYSRFLSLAARAAIAARRGGTLKAFLAQEHLLTWDWFRVAGARHCRLRRAGQLFSEFIPDGTQWSAIQRRQRQWHMDVERRAAEEHAMSRRDDLLARRARRRARWESALAACVMDLNGEAISVTPLTSGLALVLEGRRMRHCVGSYVESCRRGASRIFHLESGTSGARGTTGARATEQATVEISNIGGRWQVRQVFGPENEDVCQALRAAAKEVARRYVRAVRRPAGWAPEPAALEARAP